MKFCFRTKRAAYRRVLSEVVGHEAVREAEEIVGAAWMAGLMEAAGRVVGGLAHPGEEQAVSEFMARERAAWAAAAKVRALDAIADRERLAAAAEAAGIGNEKTQKQKAASGEGLGSLGEPAQVHRVIRLGWGAGGCRGGGSVP